MFDSKNLFFEIKNLFGNRQREKHEGVKLDRRVLAAETLERVLELTLEEIYND